MSRVQIGEDCSSELQLSSVLTRELDDTAEGRHEHVALAILTAFVEARQMATAASASIVRAKPTCPGAGYTICCDNFC